MMLTVLITISITLKNYNIFQRQKQQIKKEI